MQIVQLRNKLYFFKIEYKDNFYLIPCNQYLSGENYDGNKHKQSDDYNIIKEL